jgi:hypothetical protein
MTLELADFTVIDKIARPLVWPRARSRGDFYRGGFSLNAIPAANLRRIA